MAGVIKTGRVFAQYLRKSRTDDPASGVQETLRRHREILAAYCAEHQIQVSEEDIYEEVVSGESLYTRPQMLRLLEQVEQGRYSAVLCMDIDRLGRGKTSDQGIILETFKAADTLIVTPTRRYDLNDEVDEDYAEFEGFMARRELKMIKRRMQRGVRKTVEEGGYLPNAPYGYDKTRVGKRPSLQVNEAEAGFVRLIFELYTEKGMGCERIAGVLNSMGAVPRRSAKFGRTSVLNIIKNPVYIGRIVWNRNTRVRVVQGNSEQKQTVRRPAEEWTVSDGLHPALIEEAQFQKAQEIAGSRRKREQPMAVARNPLSGLVVCANCGGLMQRAPNIRGGPYLLCRNKGCVPASKLALVEEAVLEGVQKELAPLSGKLLPDMQSRENGEKILSAALAEKKEVQGRLNRLYDFLERGVYDTETFLARKKELEQRLAALESCARQYRLDHAHDGAGAIPVSNLLQNFHLTSPTIQNYVLKSILKKVVYSKEPGARPGAFTLDLYFQELYNRTEQTK